MGRAERYLAGAYRQLARLCPMCGSHRSGFIYRGHFKRDHHHELCVRCYRGVRERRRNCVW